MDLLICEYELPLPEELSSLPEPPDWQEFEFHTFSFKGYLDDPFVFEKYTISEDGQIYKDKIDRQFVTGESGLIELEEKEDGIEQQEYTGELVFSGLHMGEDYDYLIEFSALFWKGDLKEINLGEYKKEDAKKRLEAQEILTSAAEEFHNKEESVFFKVYKEIILSFFWLIRWSVGLMIKLTWKLERWLT